MINCIAVDDEPLALRLLEDNISKLPFLNLVASCKDAFSAIKALQENKIDLIFIDIQMPGLTGMQFVSSLENKPLVIFITAYKQYALDSYELSVVDYLVKPVALERFIKACNRAKELFELKNNKQQIEAVVAKDYFFISADYSQVKIMFDDIIIVEGLRDYVKISLLSSPKPLVVRANIKTIETELPPNRFIRVHKSYLISIAQISSIRRSSIFIKDIELPIGETYREDVEKLIGKNN